MCIVEVESKLYYFYSYISYKVTVSSITMEIYKKVLLKKPNKRDHTLIKYYWVISFLNCLGKVIKKVIAKQLLQFCKANKKLYKGQIKTKKHYSIIDITTILI